MHTYRFSTQINADFAANVKERVAQYFKENQLSKQANSEMYLKTATAFSLYLLPFVAMLVFQINSLLILFPLWIVMGVGKAFIGTSVMHDSIHGSYSKNQLINKIMRVSALLVGVDPEIWRIQHNVLHHTYTNIDGADEDIDPRYVLRFSPNQPKRWFHRYQHIYAPIIYSISTVIWVVSKDFSKAVSYKKRGLLKKNFAAFIGSIIVRKVFYFSIFLVVPMLVLEITPLMSILLFLTMHVVAGTLLSLIFQPAHVIETSQFIEKQEDHAVIEENWLTHHLRTTSNFGTESRILFWFSGGLNHQIEHHLFPNICHVHYRKISPIIKKTAKEHNIPYNTQKSLGAAVYQHLRALKLLGSGQGNFK